jgi:hypothetical protein
VRICNYRALLAGMGVPGIYEIDDTLNTREEDRE